MPSYSVMKKHIYKYRESHQEEYAEYNKQFQKKYYLENKEKMAKMKSNLYYYRKECNRMRNMLIDI